MLRRAVPPLEHRRRRRRRRRRRSSVLVPPHDFGKIPRRYTVSVRPSASTLRRSGGSSSLPEFYNSCRNYRGDRRVVRKRKVEMRILDFLTIALGTSLTSVHSKPGYEYDTLASTGDIISVKKRSEGSTSYLEQCGPVAFPMAQRGVVNVLAFLDSSWPYSHRQAIMLEMLNDRLRRSGLPDVIFFVVNVDPEFLSVDEDVDDDIEKEAWLGVFPDEVERFSDTEKIGDSLELSVTPDVRVVQDDEKLGIWKNLRGSRDQVLVIDRCGRLAYQVIVPWSILHFPYVKAAILSTYKDEPCGPCDVVEDSTKDYYKNGNEETTTNSSAEEHRQNGRESDISTSTSTKSKLGTEINISTGRDRAESLVFSTSRDAVGSSQDVNEETSITNFPEFTIATETSTLPNLILNEDNSTTEIDSEKPYESTTLPAFTDETGGNIYLREAEDPISTIFFTTGVEDSTSTVTSGTTEEASKAKTVTISRMEERKDVSMSENYLHRVDRNNVSISIENRDAEEDVTSGRATEETSDSSTPENVRITEDYNSPEDNSRKIEVKVDGSSEIPIRIIMHAPHFHVDGESTRMHEYLVLKTGSGEHHGHLSSRDATRFYSGPQDYHEKTFGPANEDVEAKHWSMTKVIYDKDESPGLYGEVADFWRTMGSQEIHEDAEDTARADEQRAEEVFDPSQTRMRDCGERPRKLKREIRRKSVAALPRNRLRRPTSRYRVGKLPGGCRPTSLTKYPRKETQRSLMNLVPRRRRRREAS